MDCPLQSDALELIAKKYCPCSLTAGGVMDILAALKAEASKHQQQLDTVQVAIKIWKRENKPCGKQKKDLSVTAKKRHPQGIPQR
jgi:uncharacterized OsmC-like protein